MVFHHDHDDFWYMLETLNETLMTCIHHSWLNLPWWWWHFHPLDPLSRWPSFCSQQSHGRSLDQIRGDRSRSLRGISWGFHDDFNGEIFFLCIVTPPQKIEMSKIVMNYCSILFFDDEIEYRTCAFFLILLWCLMGWRWWPSCTAVVRLWGETVGTELDMNGDWNHPSMNDEWGCEWWHNVLTMYCIYNNYIYIFIIYTYMSMVILLIWIVLTHMCGIVWSKILVISNRNWELNPRDIFQRGCFQVDRYMNLIYFAEVPTRETAIGRWKVSRCLKTQAASENWYYMPPGGRLGSLKMFKRYSWKGLLWEHWSVPSILIMMVCLKIKKNHGRPTK